MKAVDDRNGHADACIAQAQHPAVSALASAHALNGAMVTVAQLAQNRGGLVEWGDVLLALETMAKAAQLQCEAELIKHDASIAA